MRIAEAFCKMRLSEYCSSQDIDRAIAVTVESFIGSQKISCKKALSRAFAKLATRWNKLLTWFTNWVLISRYTLARPKPQSKRKAGIPVAKPYMHREIHAPVEDDEWGWLFWELNFTIGCSLLDWVWSLILVLCGVSTWPCKFATARGKERRSVKWLKCKCEWSATSARSYVCSVNIWGSSAMRSTSSRRQRLQASRLQGYKESAMCGCALGNQYRYFQRTP